MSFMEFGLDTLLKRRIVQLQCHFERFPGLMTGSGMLHSMQILITGRLRLIVVNDYLVRAFLRCRDILLEPRVAYFDDVTMFSAVVAYNVLETVLGL